MAVVLSCVRRLMKESLLHEKRSAAVKGSGGEKNTGFAGDQYKRERWG